MSRKKKEEGRLVSPDDMLRAASAQYLNGRRPVSEEDWEKVFNFFAFNIAYGLEESACLLLNKIYREPLPDEAVTEIAIYQQTRKEEREAAIQNIQRQVRKRIDTRLDRAVKEAVADFVPRKKEVLLARGIMNWTWYCRATLDWHNKRCTILLHDRLHNERHTHPDEQIYGEFEIEETEPSRTALSLIVIRKGGRKDLFEITNQRQVFDYPDFPDSMKGL